MKVLRWVLHVCTLNNWIVYYSVDEVTSFKLVVVRYVSSDTLAFLLMHSAVGLHLIVTIFSDLI